MPTRPPLHRPLGMPTREEQARRRKEYLDKHRPNSNARGYDTEWKKFRSAFIRDFPFCCCGCGGPTEHVDHIVSVKRRPDLRLVRSNCRPMTMRCHNARTAREQAFGRS